MVACKEAATHIYTPDLRRAQGPVSQKHTLIRLSTAAPILVIPIDSHRREVNLVRGFPSFPRFSSFGKFMSDQC